MFNNVGGTMYPPSGFQRSKIVFCVYFAIFAAKINKFGIVGKRIIILTFSWNSAMKSWKMRLTKNKEHICGTMYPPSGRIGLTSLLPYKDPDGELFKTQMAGRRKKCNFLYR